MSDANPVPVMEVPPRQPPPGQRSRAVVLDEVVRRIVAVAKPQKIILFGSAARGQDQSDSDLDILVIKDGAPRRRLAEQIHRSLIGVDWPVDVIVATPQDVERYGHSPALVLESALREGILLYAA